MRNIRLTVRDGICAAVCAAVFALVLILAAGCGTAKFEEGEGGVRRSFTLLEIDCRTPEQIMAHRPAAEESRAERVVPSVWMALIGMIADWPVWIKFGVFEYDSRQLNSQNIFVVAPEGEIWEDVKYY